VYAATLDDDDEYTPEQKKSAAATTAAPNKRKKTTGGKVVTAAALKRAKGSLDRLPLSLAHRDAPLLFVLIVAKKAAEYMQTHQLTQRSTTLPLCFSF
jgi:hypothetical protein